MDFKNLVKFTYFKKCFLLLGFLSILTIFYQLLVSWNIMVYNQDEYKNGEVACRLAILDPFDPSIKRFIYDVSLNCTSRWKEIFKSDLNSNLILVEDLKKLGYETCCYRGFQRINEKSVLYQDECTPITEKMTKIPESHEFIAVYCKEADIGHFRSTNRIVDFFGFVHKKSPKAKKIPLSTSKKLNVLILGLDSVSQMNLIRAMPKSYKYLTEDLSAIGLNGYTKVGDNTFPNIIPVLSGLSVQEFSAACWKNNRSQFDPCPLIWKDFSNEGYLTSFGEDAPGMGIFSYMKKGFKNPPTDYYLHPLVREMDRRIGNHRDLNSMICYGPRLAFDVLLDYIKKTAQTMEKTQTYFQLIWASSLFHDYLNYPRLGDESLLSTLKWLNDNGHFENTAFILMSDHGLRFGEFRETTKMGRLEDRIPFLYFVIPKWFQEKYKTEFLSMRHNRNLVSSPFDVYETLKDLLYPNQMKFRHMQQFGRGISHFRRFPLSRTCADAGIDTNWCVCEGSKFQDTKSLPVDNVLVRSAGKAFVQKLNLIVSSSKLCSKIQLNEILRAEVLTVDTNDVEPIIVSMILTLKTSPGGGVFETTLIPSSEPNGWYIPGDISRLNLFGTQSRCIKTTYLKKFCYCR